MVDLEITPSANRTEKTEVSRIITLAHGITLKVFRPNRMAMAKAREQMLKTDPEPQVPTVWVDDKGREEENPNDPAYKQAMRDWYERQGTRYLEIFIATGTRLSEVPDGVMRQDSEDYLGLLDLVGDEPARTEIQRYVQWVRLVALETQEAFEAFQQAINDFTEATEEQIAEATAKFRSQTE